MLNNPDDGGEIKDSTPAAKHGMVYQYNDPAPGKYQSSEGFNYSVTTTVNVPATKGFQIVEVDGDPVTVTYTSSNPNLVPDANIEMTGTGNERLLTITPAKDRIGTARIAVTLDDGELQTTSDFEFKVKPGGNDLVSLKPSAGVLDPVFNRLVTHYKVHVPNKTGPLPNNDVTLNVASMFPSDSLVTAYTEQGSGVTVSGSYPAFRVSGLAVGVYKPVIIRVADKAGSGYKEYRVELIRYPGNDADLAEAEGLALSAEGQPVPLSPSYHKHQLNYTAEVGPEVSQVRVNVRKSSPFSSVMLNNTGIGSIGDAQAGGDVNLAFGKNVITVQVKSEDGKTVKPYRITVIRKASSDASLTSLTTEPAGALSAFDPAKLEYTLAVNHNVNAASFTPVAAPGATIRINGDNHPSGVLYAAGDLSPGANMYTIEVTAQDGVTKKVYRLAIVRALSDVADLAAIDVQDAALNPMFSNEHTAYSIVVPYWMGQINLTPQLADTASELSVDGLPHASGALYSKLLRVGINPITLKVTSESGTVTKTTLVTVIREASSNANLSSLDVSAGALAPLFDRDQTEYAVTVENDVKQISITPVTEDKTASLLLNGIPAADGLGTPVELQTGTNTVTVTVRAQDGKTIKNYTLTIVRKASSNADLKDLTLNGAPLSGGFDPATSTYVEHVANNVSAVTAAAVTSDPLATYKINGLESKGGVPVPLKVGENLVTVVTTAPDGVTTKEYTVTVIRAASGNANLQSLVLTGEGGPVPLSPEFHPDTTVYSASIEDGIPNLELAALAEDPEVSSISYWLNGVEVVDPLLLTPVTGLNVIEVRVTAEDGSIKKYTVNLTKNPSTDASLKELNSSVEYAPGFEPGVEDYSANVENGINSLTLFPLTNHPDAAYTITNNDNEVINHVVNLEEGSNVITIKVTAPDQTTVKTYTLTVNREVLPKDASLAGLSVTTDRGTETLTPEFSSSVAEYTVEVPYTIDQAFLLALTNDSHALLSINGIPAGQHSAIGLLEGVNTFDVTVTAQDHKTKQVYTVKITRKSPSSDADIREIV